MAGEILRRSIVKYLLKRTIGKKTNCLILRTIKSKYDSSGLLTFVHMLVILLRLPLNFCSLVVIVKWL